MNLYQILLTVGYAILFSFGIYNLIKSFLVYNKNVNNKHFFFALSAIFSGVYVLFSFYLSYEISDELILLYNRIRMAGIIIAIGCWLHTQALIYLKKQIIPLKILIPIIIFFLITVMTNLFISLPAYYLRVYINIHPFDYRWTQTNIFYILFGIFVVFSTIYSMVVILRSSLSIKIKFISVLSFLPGLLSINDFLVVLGYAKNIMITEYTLFIYFIVIKWFFLKEDEEKHSRIKNINVELERKIEARTAELLETNKKLNHAATTDLLTGVYNRNEFEKRVVEEKSRMDRYNAAMPVRFSIIFIDLDNFKYYNDTFGHHIGDLILKEFAGILKQESRKSDFIARFGGDEFVILLTETEENEAVNMSKRIKELIHLREHFQPEIEKVLNKSIIVPKNYKLSFSVGITEYIPESGIDFTQLLIHADQALYKAKKSGKNCCVLWENMENKI